ncbi:putative DNA base hypermodification protein, partial [Staphylococcus aureus]|nr:putative DNA base hypermodification protein [Staphylococcus aureus]
HLESTLGEITLRSFNPEVYCKVLAAHKANASRLYSAAYIMPSGKNEYGSSIKHENNIRMLQAMIKDNLHKKVWEISD